MFSVDDELHIPMTEFDFSYARSGGPGGQNVNKVNTKAILHWSVATTESIPEDVRARFLTRFANRITQEGELVISSQRYRDQSRNVDDCLDKLREMLAAVLKPPVLRRKTKPSKAVKQRRLEVKRAMGQKKAQRRRPQMRDDD